MKRKGPNVWVVRDGRQFSIKEEGSPKPLILPTTQRAATRIARILAKANRSELVVQSRRARIRVKDSHGFDSPYRDG